MPQEAASMATTCRVAVEPETRAREAVVALDHLSAIQIHAPNVDVAARLAVSHLAEFGFYAVLEIVITPHDMTR